MGGEGRGVDVIIILALLVDLVEGRLTLFMLSISSWSMRELRRWACPVFRSFDSFSFPRPYWYTCHMIIKLLTDL